MLVTYRLVFKGQFLVFKANDCHYEGIYYLTVDNYFFFFKLEKKGNDNCLKLICAANTERKFSSSLT